MSVEENSDLSESRFSLSTAWNALRKHWLVAALIAACVTAGVGFYTLGQTKIYQASATILFDPNIPRPLGEQVQAVVASDSSSYWNNKEYYRTQNWMLQSLRVATQVVEDLQLNRDASFLRNVPADGKRSDKDLTTKEAAANELMKRLTVEPVKDSRLTSVRYQDADPARAQKILATLVDTYAQNNLDDVFEAATSASDWLRSQVGTLRTDLEKTEMALHEYKKNKNILSVSMDDQSNMLREEMKQLNAALTEVRAKRQRVAARAAEIRKVTGENPQALPAFELIESPVLQELRAEYVSAEKELNASRGSGKANNHPETRSAVARFETTKAALLAEVKNIQIAIERDLMALDNEIAGLQKLFTAAEQRALEVNLLEIEYNRLRRAKDTNERLFSIVIERSKESDLSKMLRVNNIRVVERPLLPTRPVRPDVPLNLAGGAVAGILLGLVAALGREYLDRTVKNPDDVERELRLPFLGLIPELAKAETVERKRRERRGRQLPPAEDSPPELYAHYHPSSGIAEAVRAIRTNVLFMSPDHPYRVLLVSSAGPAEGKTTVACALATTMAQAGQRVLLIDCDLRRPRIHKVFRRSNDFGLTSALLDSGSEATAIRDTEVANLWMLPTGPLPPNPAELLHSEAFAKVLGRLRSNFDRVIIDSPPIVPVTDAAVLSTIVDGTIVVVRAQKTTREIAKRALRSIRDVGGKIVGIVLNAVDLEGRGYGSYQYYYYKRDGYAAEPPNPPGPSGDNQVEHVGNA